AARWGRVDPLASDAGLDPRGPSGGRPRARPGLDRARWREAARASGGRRTVGWRGMEPRVEFHHACAHAVARPGSRSCERPGTPGGRPGPRTGDLARVRPAGM